MPRRIVKKADKRLFSEVVAGKRSFDIRVASFDVQQGDVVVFQEWDDERKEYTGRSLEARVTFVQKTKDHHFWTSAEALKLGFQVMQLEFDGQLARGIEPVCCVVVRDEDGDILLVRSDNWSGRWTLPGGSIRAGEPITMAATREIREETGLAVMPLATFHSGELIRSSDYHRAAHFLFFGVVADAVTKKLTLDRRQVSEARWFPLALALKADLAPPFRDVLRAYQRWVMHDRTCEHRS